MEREFQQHVNLKRELSQAVKWRGQKTISACLRVAIPSPPKVKRSEATSTQTWHYSCSVTSLFFKKIYNDVLLVNLFCLVIYFHTNELVNKTLSWSTFQTTGIHDEVFKASLLDFWDRNISRRTAESRRYVFRKVTMSPFNWLWKIFNILSSAGNRSPFFFRWNRLLYLLCRPLKLSQETRCTILMYLGQEALQLSVSLWTALQSY